MSVKQSYCGCGKTGIDENEEGFIYSIHTHHDYVDHTGYRWDYYDTRSKIYVNFCPWCGRDVSRLMNRIRRKIKEIFYE